MEYKDMICKCGRKKYKVMNDKDGKDVYYPLECDCKLDEPTCSKT